MNRMKMLAVAALVGLSVGVVAVHVYASCAQPGESLTLQLESVEVDGEVETDLSAYEIGRVILRTSMDVEIVVGTNDGQWVFSEEYDEVMEGDL